MTMGTSGSRSVVYLLMGLLVSPPVFAHVPVEIYYIIWSYVASAMIVFLVLINPDISGRQKKLITAGVVIMSIPCWLILGNIGASADSLLSDVITSVLCAAPLIGGIAGVCFHRVASRRVDRD